MYKYLIVGVTLLVVGGAGYYFNSSGGSDLIVQAIAQTDGENYGVSGIEVFSGTYSCDASDGCEQVTTLILSGDTTLEITRLDEEGLEQQIGTGSWGVGTGGALIFLINPTTSGTTTAAFSFVAKKISILKLSGFSSKIKSYEGLNNPTFTRVSNESSNEESSFE